MFNYDFSPVRKDLVDLSKKLLAEKCIDHRKIPFVKVRRDDLEVTACCDKFMSHLEAMIEEEKKKSNPPGPLIKRKVLVVDDEVDFGALMRFYLEKKGCEVDVCTNLKDADEYLEENEPDIIIVDRFFAEQLRVPDNDKAKIFVTGGKSLTSGGFDLW
ncbi:response regulator [Segetibacter sp. 3557_3]|uniref:response regulator transcription factor n=1 Tax=Segetibacter sp. 3557_3 TaxID=2547429 RepID=UPI001059098A|nr:response regulator [Segetibacter sp. 3557_3]TDH21251.1 response regulator [Segetibacter sp. 3557_3]